MSVADIHFARANGSARDWLPIVKEKIPWCIRKQRVSEVNRACDVHVQVECVADDSQDRLRFC